MAACKKYSEGGTKWNQENKIKGTIWWIDAYNVDGADSLGYLNDSILNCSTYSVTFYDPNENFGYSDVSLGGCGESSGGSWSLPNKNEISISVFTLDSLARPEHKIFMQNWRIMCLTGKDFWVQQTRNEKLYEIEFLKPD
ncbi:MAG: hypothetical protein COA57_00045 [Flavobacteriales bacterium]|nr:MAG: hypothetical protein COA57_00045 [Flavobacteriales bacterium]